MAIDHETMSSNHLKVFASAPTRIDIVGGTLDLWPIHNILNHKATVNIGIDLEASVELELSPDNFFRVYSVDQRKEIIGTFGEVCESSELPLISLVLKHVWAPHLPPLNIKISAKSPAGAGLGGSSCLSIVLLKGLYELKKHLTGSICNITEDFLVRTAQDIESVIIHAPTGIQDYWGAIRGGVNIISYEYGITNIETITLSDLLRGEFEIVCVYSGSSRASAINNWEIFKRVFDRDLNTIKALNEIGEYSQSCADAVKSGKFDQVLNLSKLEWECRLRLWPGIETEKTKSISKAAIAAGAVFSRVCGAGGGGVMAIFTKNQYLNSVKKAAEDAGGQVLNAALGVKGLACSLQY